MKILSLVLAVLSVCCATANASTVLYDAKGFESKYGYSLGNLGGQQGWTVMTMGSAHATIVNDLEPVIGKQAVRLDAPSCQVNPEDSQQIINDNVTISHDLSCGNTALDWVTVEVSIWTASGARTYQTSNGAVETHNNTYFNELTWGSSEGSNIIGSQETDGNTYPCGAASTATTVGEYSNIRVSYDFVNHIKSSWYNGVLLDSNVAFSTADNTWSDILFTYQHANPADPDFALGQPVYIDNLVITGETVPEPSAILALLTGVIGIGGFAVRRRK